MLPTLRPGDEFVASDSLPPRPGDVVAFPHPERQDFWLVKRMVTPPTPIPAGTAWVVSDNAEATLADSRSFGPVPASQLLTRVEQLSATTFREAVDLLVAEDDHLARTVMEDGLPAFWQRPEGFATLVLLILEQQVSLESGDAMFRRLHGLCGTVSAPAILATGSEALRRIGVTRQKTRYLGELARRVTTGEFPVDELGGMPPSEARQRLLEVPGIGPWTADAYLLSALRWPDVFPTGDRALQVGVMETLGLSHMPEPQHLEELSRPWRPIRAVAARLIWHGYLHRRGRSEPPFPS